MNLLLCMNVNSCDFAFRTSKEAAGIFCINSYHHGIVVELAGFCFDTFAESLLSPCLWTPVILLQPIWDLMGYICNLKDILLNLALRQT